MKPKRKYAFYNIKDKKKEPLIVVWECGQKACTKVTRRNLLDAGCTHCFGPRRLKSHESVTLAKVENWTEAIERKLPERPIQKRITEISKLVNVNKWNSRTNQDWNSSQTGLQTTSRSETDK